MENKKELKEEQLKKVGAGARIGGDDHFGEVTELLKAAGNRAWPLFAQGSNDLWYHINQAEITPFTSTRKENIKSALVVLENCKDRIEFEDYSFIKEKLDESNELTK